MKVYFFAILDRKAYSYLAQFGIKLAVQSSDSSVTIGYFNEQNKNRGDVI